MTRLDQGSRLVIARDRIDWFRAEAAADHLARPGRRRLRGEAGDGWEGRPAHSPASARVLALVGRTASRPAPRRPSRAPTAEPR